MRRELIELGHTVVPKQPLPLVAGELVAVVQGCLEQADFAIHFVGEHFGLVPEATDLSMVALQNQVAARFCDNSSLERLIWIPKGLQPRDERQTSFIRQLQADPRTITGAELIADTLENLKVLLRTRWEREQAERDKPQPGTSTGGAPRVYLVCDQNDEAALEPLEDHFYDQGIEVSLPGFEAEESEVQQIHIQNLRDCDAALIYYGCCRHALGGLQDPGSPKSGRLPGFATHTGQRGLRRTSVQPPQRTLQERVSGSDPAERQLICTGIADGLHRGHPPGEGGRLMHTVDSQPTNPFPGLRPFRSDEHHLFFGREEQTAALLQLLRTNRFLAVVGTSGSGKSSLVRAGMIAELHGGTMTQAGSTWEVIILRPGGSPIENLARAFVEADLYDREDPSTLPRLLATLNRSRFGLVEAMKQCDLFEPGTNLLVVVDQFEELFRFRQQGVDSEETAAAFVNLLLSASEQAECPIYVTITMRSDYLGDCSEIPGLAEAVNEGEYLIPRLLRDQKRDAIEKPIGVGGAKISPMLVQRLLNDVGDDPDQLPVLQHALMRMWDAWSTGADHDRPIDFADFEATGGLAAALSNHADEIHDALPF